jgi:hypothetical protein
MSCINKYVADLGVADNQVVVVSDLLCAIVTMNLPQNVDTYYFS